MEEEFKILLAYVAVALNMKESEVETLAKDKTGGLKALKEKHSEFASDKLQEGQDKVLGMFKKQYKSVFGKFPDVNDPAKFKEALAALKEELEKDPEETELDVKKIEASEPYKLLKQQLEDKEKEVETIKTDNEKALLQRDVNDKGLSLLKSMNAIIPEKESAAKTRQNLYLSQLSGYDYEADGKGDFFLKDKTTGEYLKNEGKHKMTLTEFGKGLVEDLYGVAPVQQRQNADPPAGPPNPAGGAPAGGAEGPKYYKGAVPKTREELQAIQLDDNLSGLAKQEARTMFESANPPT